MHSPFLTPPRSAAEALGIAVSMDHLLHRALPPRDVCSCQAQHPAEPCWEAARCPRALLRSGGQTGQTGRWGCCGNAEHSNEAWPKYSISFKDMKGSSKELY